MPSSKITVPNPVGKDEALKRIKGLTSGGENLDVQENWTDDGGTFSGEIYGLDVSIQPVASS